MQLDGGASANAARNKAGPFALRCVRLAARRPGREARRQRGFTVVEILAVLAIVAILIRIALPSIRNMVMNNSVASANNQLMATLNYARGEAVADRSTVYLCNSSTTTSTAQNCDSSTSNGFQEGWVIYEVFSDYSSKVLKYVTPDATSGVTINANSVVLGSSNGVFGFNQLGTAINTKGSGAGAVTTAAAGVGYIVICDTRKFANSGQFARVISISKIGSISSVAGNKQLASSPISTCTT